MSLIIEPKKTTSLLPKSSAADQLMGQLGGAAQVGIRTFESLTGLRMDPAPSYLFYVEITGIIVALFTQCRGIGATRMDEVIEEGGYNNGVHHLPGPVRHNNITLSRGLSISRELWRWFEAGQYDFGVKRVNLSIYQGAPGMNLASALGMSSSGYGVVKQWNVEGAYPVSWNISDLDVNNTESAVIESIEIAHSGISLSPIAGTPMSAVGSLVGQ